MQDAQLLPWNTVATGAVRAAHLGAAADRGGFGRAGGAVRPDALAAWWAPSTRPRPVSAAVIAAFPDCEALTSADGEVLQTRNQLL